MQVHYDIPASADLYVHRSGRTARAAQDGVAVALITPDDSRTWDRLQATLDRPSGTVPEFPVVSTIHALPTDGVRFLQAAPGPPLYSRILSGRQKCSTLAMGRRIYS